MNLTPGTRVRKWIVVAAQCLEELLSLMMRARLLRPKLQHAVGYVGISNRFRETLRYRGCCVAKSATDKSPNDGTSDAPRREVKTNTQG